MRGRILLSVGTLLVVALVYEVTFRHITASCGLVDMQANPPRVYYSKDSGSWFPWRGTLYGFRMQLPFGKVRLWPEHLYVGGGRIYCHLPDGGWQDLTDTTLADPKVSP